MSSKKTTYFFDGEFMSDMEIWSIVTKRWVLDLTRLTIKSWNIILNSEILLLWRRFLQFSSFPYPTLSAKLCCSSGPPAHRALTASGCCRRSPYQVKSTDSERTVATPNKNLPSETAEGCVEKPQDDMRRNWMCFLLQKVQRSGVLAEFAEWKRFFSWRCSKMVQEGWDKYIMIFMWMG